MAASGRQARVTGYIVLRGARSARPGEALDGLGLTHIILLTRGLTRRQ